MIERVSLKRPITRPPQATFVSPTNSVDITPLRQRGGRLSVDATRSERPKSSKLYPPSDFCSEFLLDIRMARDLGNDGVDRGRVRREAWSTRAHVFNDHGLQDAEPMLALTALIRVEDVANRLPSFHEGQVRQFE